MTPRQFQVAVYFIGATLMVCVLGIIGITVATDDPIPDVLQNIAVGSLTGLVGLLVTPREPIQQVEVVKDQRGYTTLDIIGVAILAAVLLFVFFTLTGNITVTIN